MVTLLDSRALEACIWLWAWMCHSSTEVAVEKKELDAERMGKQAQASISRRLHLSLTTTHYSLQSIMASASLPPSKILLEFLIWLMLTLNHTYRDGYFRKHNSSLARLARYKTTKLLFSSNGVF